MATAQGQGGRGLGRCLEGKNRRNEAISTNSPFLPRLNNPFFLCIPLVLPSRAIILETRQFTTYPAGFKKELV